MLPSPGRPVPLQGSLDNINLFSIITIMAFFLLAPVTLLTEGVKFTPGAIEAMGVANPSALMQKAVLAGFCFHAYQQVRAPCEPASSACWAAHRLLSECREASAAWSQGRPLLLRTTPATLVHVVVQPISVLAAASDSRLHLSALCYIPPLFYIG